MAPFTALCLLSAAAIAAGGQPATRGAVEGQVYLADGQHPASGAFVFLLAPLMPRKVPPKEFVVSNDEPARGDFHAVADAGGRARIDDVKPGTYYVVVQLPGYICAEDYVFPGSLSSAKPPAFVQKVVVRPGAVAHFKIRLEPGGSIEGRVRSGSGGAIEGVALILLIRRKDGSFGDVFVGARHTDSHGRYSFAGLPPASYIVVAGLAGPMVPTSRGYGGTSGPLILSGNTLRTSQARVIEVSGTAIQSGVDITFPTDGLHAVTGRVEFPGGVPVVEGIVRLSPGGESACSRANPIQADGTFAFDRVADGEYTLTAEYPLEWEMAGPTPNGKGRRMRQRKQSYMPVTQNIRVEQHDLSRIVLRPHPAP